MRFWICLFFALPAFKSVFGQAESFSKFGATPGLGDAEIREGWLSLFDGKTLFGWHAGSEADWVVKDGCIEVSSGVPGLLRTSVEFDDFELNLETRFNPETNSGIFLRTSPRPMNPSVDCIEFNLADRKVSPFPTGSLVKRSTAEVDFENDRWLKVRIVVNGPRVQGWVDGTMCCDHLIGPNEASLNRGYIGLQYNAGPVKFRNIRVRPLKVTELKFTESLKGWSNREARQSLFTVRNGEMRILGGPGQLETENSHGNFILSVECKTNKAGLNSGIFFRSIPGEWMNGYESQIHSGFENEDRTKPADCGTGGIFRRQNARLVNSEDEEWFRKTIIACGPQVSVWVNGFQVTDWKDSRKIDDNPRKGRRLEAGTIILQGHDPTTDVTFRNFSLRELSERVR